MCDGSHMLRLSLEAQETLLKPGVMDKDIREMIQKQNWLGAVGRIDQQMQGFDIEDDKMGCITRLLRGAPASEFKEIEDPNDIPAFLSDFELAAAEADGGFMIDGAVWNYMSLVMPKLCMKVLETGDDALKSAMASMYIKQLTNVVQAPTVSQPLPATTECNPMLLPLALVEFKKNLEQHLIRRKLLIRAYVKQKTPIALPKADLLSNVTEIRFDFGPTVKTEAIIVPKQTISSRTTLREFFKISYVNRAGIQLSATLDEELYRPEMPLSQLLNQEDEEDNWAVEGKTLIVPNADRYATVTVPGIGGAARSVPLQTKTPLIRTETIDRTIPSQTVSAAAASMGDDTDEESDEEI